MPKQEGRVANPSEIVAIAGVFKAKEIKEAKHSLPENSHRVINMTVEITGSVAKSGGIADGEMVPPKVNLTKLPTTCALLRQLGIGPKRLRDALLASGEVECDDDEEQDLTGDELAAVFADVARELASKRPLVPAKGVSPKVTSVLSARVIKSV